MVELLLAHGAEVARKDDLGDTPLGIALRSKHSEVVKLLRPVVDQARVELESKQSTPAPADPPWGAECKQGNAHFQSGDYSRAAASYTLALSHHSNPPGAAALLYSNRAAALLKLGAFAKAGEDARVGLALFSGGESLPGELQLKRKLEDASGEAGLGVGVEEAAGRTRGVSGDAQTVIAAESPLGVALLDLESTAWFYEMDGRALRPGLKGSKVRFLATLWVTSCITVFVSGPDGRAFGVHLNSAFAMVSVRGRPDGGRWGTLNPEP
ncbi:hypothetical protein T484DRAFT_2183017 [Baffinella frigidus]|nr:hypothetical protein T484DRAFT_2183017 [Cryptophyta sp. CCMP2293]